MRFPQDFIDRVRESTNLVDVIGSHVELRRTGHNHQGLCPFHNEKSPSFSVSEDKQVYHCFGCKASGNVYSFLQNFQGLSFPEAVEYLAKRAGLALPEDSSAQARDPAKEQKASLFKLNALAAQLYHRALQSLPSDHEAKLYLKKRNLDEQTIEKYKIGYAPDSWSHLADFFTAQKAPLALAEQLGLIKRRSGGKSGYYDLFRHRLMFPIFSPVGQCLGFGGRVLSSEQQPKYLNSPDSVVFHKGQVFYGLDHSAKFIRGADEALIVEGYMDWLALAKVEINHAVATLGTALTQEHARAIKRYTNKVLLLFDGDSAGKSAARRSLPILLKEGLFVRGIFLPEQLDPDDFIKKHGALKLREHIKAAPDLFDLVINEAWQEAKSSPSGKVQVLDEFATLLSAIEDTRLKRLYADNLANLLDIDVRLIGQTLRNQSTGEVKPVALKKPKTETPAPIAGLIDLTKISETELQLLNVILSREVYLKEALEAELEPHFVHLGAQSLFTRIAQEYRQMPSKFDNLTALLANEVTPIESITRHLAEPYTSLTREAGTKLLHDCIRRMKEKSLRQKAKDLASSLLSSGPVNSTDQLEQIMNIQKNRRSLNRDS